MCNNHQTSPHNNSDGQGSGVYPDLTGMFGNQNGHNTHQNNAGAGATGQEPSFSHLMMQLMRETERYLREQYPAEYQHQSNNNATPSAPPSHDQVPGQQQQSYNNNNNNNTATPSAPPQHEQQNRAQQHSSSSYYNNNATPTTQQPTGQGRYQQQGPQQHQQHQQGRYSDADAQRMIQELINGFRTFRAVFGKTLVNVLLVVMVIWLLNITPSFIMTNLIFLVVAPSLGLSICDMVACNILMNIINSFPPVLLAAVGCWIFHRKFIKGKPLFTCNKWDNFRRRCQTSNM